MEPNEVRSILRERRAEQEAVESGVLANPDNYPQTIEFYQNVLQARFVLTQMEKLGEVIMNSPTNEQRATADRLIDEALG